MDKLPRPLHFVAKNPYFIDYNKEILQGIISKLYKIQGTKITKAITIGNNIIQQKVIN
jgi:hypothetical protein